MVAAVDGDPGAQPVGVGTADAVVMGFECFHGAGRQGPGHIEFAQQPADFAVYQQQARFQAGALQVRQLGHRRQGGRFARQFLRALAVALP